MIRALLLVSIITLAGCSGESDDPDAAFRKDLSAATSQARAKLPLFWEHFDAPEVDEYDFSLKASLPRRDGQPGAMASPARRMPGSKTSPEATPRSSAS